MELEAFKQTISQLASDLANILLDRNSWKLKAEGLQQLVNEVMKERDVALEQFKSVEQQISAMQEHAAELEHRLDSIKNA